MSLEFSPQGYTPDGVAVFGSDAQAMVKFFVHPEISVYKSQQEGRPVYDDVVMIEVMQPGEKEPIRQLANEWHKRRFQRQWDNYEKGRIETSSGTPLSVLFPTEPSTILQLNGFNIFTVDQLAAISDTAIGNIPMGRALVDRAKAFLGTAAGGAEYHRMQKQIADLQQQLSSLAEQGIVPPLPTQAKRGPGRPPNAPKEGTA